jgi:glucan 1,3-beta-glucosidase
MAIFWTLILAMARTTVSTGIHSIIFWQNSLIIFQGYVNQNNMWRQVRNFIIDVSPLPETTKISGIHWQTAQATSLQNIIFQMRPASPKNQQQGIFMENGSGGWMSDLIFNGGGIAAFMGNQQFTCRNLTFNNCNTAIYQNWGWVWNYKNLVVNNCKIGLDMSSGNGTAMTISTIIAQDAVFNNVDIGAVTTFGNGSSPVAAGGFICDNCDFRTTNVAIAYPNRTVIVPGGQVVQSYVQGRVYSVADTSIYSPDFNRSCYGPVAQSARVQTLANAPPKPSVLLDKNNYFVTRPKPQYEDVPVSKFVSVKDHGAKGDGVTDDTNAIQAILNSATFDQVVYFDHGVYIVSDTIQVPKNIRITGEIWPVIMAKGTAFSDWNNPKPVWRVGNPGDVGSVEMSDLVFGVQGPAVGAIMTEWNLESASPGSAGMIEAFFALHCLLVLTST